MVKHLKIGDKIRLKPKYWDGSVSIDRILTITHIDKPFFILNNGEFLIEDKWIKLQYELVLSIFEVIKRKYLN